MSSPSKSADWPRGDELALYDHRLSLIGADHARWDGGVETGAALRQSAQNGRRWLWLTLPHPAFLSFDRPTTVELNLTLGLFTPDAEVSVPVGPASHPASGLGICNAIPMVQANQVELWLMCRQALRRAGFAQVALRDTVTGTITPPGTMGEAHGFFCLPGIFGPSPYSLAPSHWPYGARFFEDSIAARLREDPARVDVILRPLRAKAFFDFTLRTPPVRLADFGTPGR